jgi:murein DD-endopeptidase MepM/ murein hydrolase activator NlpD
VPNAPAPKVETPVTTTEAPGVGTPTPTPPSATKPLPAEKTVAKSTPQPTPTQPKASSTGKLAYPVNGKIIREYSKGKNEGIDIAAASGSAVGAAEAGSVIYVSPPKDDLQIVIVKHPNDLTTVYANIDAIAIKKGQSVSRGEKLASIPAGQSSYVHFEVRKGLESVDPLPYLK